MAKKTVTYDDLDGSSEAAETVLFLVDGEFLEIDLTTENAKKFRSGLSKYVQASRIVGAKDAMKRVTQGLSGNGAAQGSYDPTVVREWARENGIAVNEKGRVPEHIVGHWRRAVAGTAGECGSWVWECSRTYDLFMLRWPIWDQQLC